MGIVADRWGHRVSLILGSFGFVLTMATLALTTNFWLLMLSWVLWAVSVTLVSGADEAFLFESLDSVNLGTKYRHYFGRSQAVTLISSAIGSLIASPLYQIVAVLPIAINGVAAFIATLFISITRPVKKRVHFVPLSLTQTWHKIKQDLRRFNIGTVIFIGALAYALFWSSTLFYQPYLLEIGVPLDYFGGFYVVILFSGAFGAFIALRLSKWVGDARLIGGLLILLWLAGLPMALTFSRWALVGIVVIWLGYYIINSIISDNLQKLVSSDVRATIGSMRNFIGSILVIFTRVIAGAVADNLGLQAGLVVLMFLLLPCFAVGVYLVQRKWKSIFAN